MLAKKYRLNLGVRLSAPQSFITPLFIVKKEKNSLSYSRYGVIITKKIAVKAVDRNLLRRIIFSGIPKNSQETEGYDMIFIAKKEIMTAKKEEVNAEVERIIHIK